MPIMSVRNRVPALIAATLASALLLSGCGGGPSLPTGLFNAPSTSASSQAVLPGSGGSTGSGGSGGSGGTGGSGGAGIGSFNSDCLGVAGAYSTIALALLPSLGAAGSGTYDAAQLTQAISGLGGSVPAPLKADFQTMSEAAKQASGKSLADAGQILSSPAVTAASDDISKWMTANCGG